VFEAPQLVSDGPSDGGRRIVLGNDLAVSSKTGLVYFTESKRALAFSNKPKRLTLVRVPGSAGSVGAVPHHV